MRTGRVWAYRCAERRLLQFHVVDVRRLGEALEGERSAAVELERLADAQLPHGDGDRDPARPRTRTEAGRQLHGGAEQDVIVADRLTCAETYTHVQTLTAIGGS